MKRATSTGHLIQLLRTDMYRSELIGIDIVPQKLYIKKVLVDDTYVIFLVNTDGSDGHALVNNKVNSVCFFGK